MRSRTYLLASLLAALILAAALLVGCGASNQSKGGSDNGSGQAKQQQAKKDEGKKGKDGKTAERKIALGSIVTVNAKTNKFALKPSDSKSGDKPMKFRAGKGAKIMSEGKKAEFSDIKKGQQVKIEYVVKQDKNRARLVQLVGGGGEKTSGGGEATS